MNSILIDTIKDCSNNKFHSFENSCAHDKKFTNIENIEEVNLTITDGYSNFKSHFYGLKKLKNALKNGFRFSEIVKLTIKIDLSIANINICYYLKMPLAIVYRQFLRITSQNLDYVEKVCNCFEN